MSFYRPDPQLDKLGTAAIASTIAKFPDVDAKQLAVTWLVYDRPIPVNTGGAITAEEFWKYNVRGFSHRSHDRIYPASVVKLFYAVAIAEWLERGMTASSPELDRAIRDAIVDSSNDATSLVVDVLTGTTSGPELPPAPFTTWCSQRNIINRYFQSLGWPELDKINVNQKTWSEGPYGRERAFVGEMRQNRNMLTTDAVARLLHAIVGGVVVSRDRSLHLMDLLQRDLQLASTIPPAGEENQVYGFLGAGTPPESQIWSKAGWTSQVRHDAAYIESPDRLPYLLVVFAEGNGNPVDLELLPHISGEIASMMAEVSIGKI
jgi:hypothetical protein